MINEMNDMKIHDLPVEKEFDLDLIGNFGRFKSKNSYPVDYFLTTLSMAQASRYLKFARDIEMREINFDLLMQRDIWEERVRDEIIPYLTQAIDSGAERPVFFPPILLAIVPIKAQELQNLYGPPKPFELEGNFAGIKWHGNFQVFGRTTDGSEGLQIGLLDDSPRINAKQAVMNLRTTIAYENGVDLVVIDGQHRLRALKLLYDEQRELIQDLVLPVCILYPPESHSGFSDLDNVPTVPRVFRSLFVDVNSTMEVVGGHFTILLSDKNIGDITCRVFCDYVLHEGERDALALIEWNTRTKKNSFNVTKPYTLTSIGIINKALAENFRTDTFVSYLLNISSGDEDLFPEGASNEDYLPKIKWDSFTYAQSTILAERARTHFVPLLNSLYFSTHPFTKIVSIFDEEIARLRQEKRKGGKSGASANAVLRKIIEYAPFNQSDPDFKKRLIDFEDSIEEKVNSSGYGILRYALFQRAVFNVLSEMLKLTLNRRLSPEYGFRLFQKLIENVFENGSASFGTDKAYMQFTAFDQKNIRAREDTRKAFKYLILSHFLQPAVLDKVLEDVDDEERNKDLRREITDIAFTNAGELISLYRRERERSFRKNYDIDYSLSRDERQQLKIAEMEQRQMEKEIQEGARDRDSLDMKFDTQIQSYIQAFTNQAENELREALSISVAILEKSEKEDELDTDE